MKSFNRKQKLRQIKRFRQYRDKINSTNSERVAKSCLEEIYPTGSTIHIDGGGFGHYYIEVITPDLESYTSSSLHLITALRDIFYKIYNFKIYNS